MKVSIVMFTFVLAGLLVKSNEVSGMTPGSNLDETEKLFQDYFEWKLSNNPLKATMLGFSQYANEVTLS